MQKYLTIMKNKIILVFIIIFTSIFIIHGQEKNVVDRILAVVGNNLILQSDVEAQYLQISQGRDYKGIDLKCDIFEDLLYQNLLLHHAEMDSLTVTDREVDSELERRIRYFVMQIGSEKKLEDYFGKTMTEIKNDLRENLKKQLLSEQMEHKITSSVKITPTEVRNFFKNLPKDSIPYIEEELEYEQIVIYPAIPEEIKLLTKEKLNDLRERVLKGDNFSTLAVMYSEDPGSSPRGGELGLVGRTELVPEFTAVAFNLEPGETSRIVETEFGYHIIQLIERRGELINVRHILMSPKSPLSETQKARRTLDSITVAIRTDSISFAKAAEKFSQDDNTKFNNGLAINPYTGNSRFQSEHIDPITALQLRRLKLGEISQPFEFTDERGKKGTKIVRLKSRIPAHYANLKDDYQIIQEGALENKKQEVITNWIKRHLKITFIQIDESFHNCQYKFPEWVKK